MINDKDSAKAFVDHWRQVGPVLEEARRRELQGFDPQRDLFLIDALFQLGFEMSPPRTTSGMVEMQRLFAKTRR